MAWQIESIESKTPARHVPQWLRSSQTVIIAISQTAQATMFSGDLSVVLSLKSLGSLFTMVPVRPMKFPRAISCFGVTLLGLEKSRCRDS